jgi:hypothetical protein
MPLIPCKSCGRQFKSNTNLNQHISQSNCNWLREEWRETARRGLMQSAEQGMVVDEPDAPSDGPNSERARQSTATEPFADDVPNKFEVMAEPQPDVAERRPFRATVDVFEDESDMGDALDGESDDGDDGSESEEEDVIGTSGSASVLDTDGSSIPLDNVNRSVPKPTRAINEFHGAAKVLRVDPVPGRSDNPFYPFRNRLDFDIAHWAKTEKISQGALTRLLETPGVSICRLRAQITVSYYWRSHASAGGSPA